MGFIRLWGIFLLFPAFGYSAPPVYNAPYTYGSPVDDRTTMSKVELAAQKSRNIVQLLSQLPKEFRSRPVFMFDSKSLHHATPEQPRIILFSLDASFLLAFPLDPNAPSAEMAQATGSKFAFKEIAFRNNQTAAVSKANTPKCLECHQSPHRADVDPRPNWEPYPRWGGTLGQEDKAFTNYDKKPFPEQERLVAKIREWQTGTTNPIVKLLDLSGVIEAKKGMLQTIGPIALTHKLAALNFRRVARLMTTSPVYPLYRKEIVACMTTNGSGQDAGLDGMPKVLADYLRSFQFPYLNTRFDRGIHGCLTRIFAPHGTDTSDWPMAFRTNEVLFDQFSTPLGSGMEMYAALREFDKTLPKWNIPLERPTLVSRLDVKSAEKLLSDSRPALEKMERGETLLNRCKQCHLNSASGAPYVDFSEETLRKRRDEITYRITTVGADQMPPRNRLKENEIRHLLQYLEKFR